MLLRVGITLDDFAQNQPAIVLRANTSHSGRKMKVPSAAPSRKLKAQFYLHNMGPGRTARKMIPRKADQTCQAQSTTQGNPVTLGPAFDAARFSRSTTRALLQVRVIGVPPPAPTLGRLALDAFFYFSGLLCTFFTPVSGVVGLSLRGGAPSSRAPPD